MADIDECLEGTFKCDVSMECKNIHGSYKCVCGEGLYWIDNRCQGKTKRTVNTTHTKFFSFFQSQNFPVRKV